VFEELFFASELDRGWVTRLDAPSGGDESLS
jgi:hypothetical protein